MKILALILTVLIYSFLSQLVLGQNIRQSKSSKQPIGCSDCGFPIKAIPTHLPKPGYPLAALAVNASGNVGVVVTINKRGKVTKAVAVSGHLLLQAAAIKAALKATFQPVIISGKPTLVTGVITYLFSREDSVRIEVEEKSKQSETSKTISLGVLNDKAKVLPLPKLLNVQPRIAGSVNVQVKIDLQKGEVVSTSAVSGHPLLRMSAEIAARQAKFEPILTEFPTIYGMGILTYKVEDFTGKVVENNNPKPFSIINKDILNSKTTFFAAPVKTREASAACVGGKLEVAVLVDAASGEVIAAKGVSGKEILYETVETAALKSKFSPSAIDGSGNIYIKGKFLYEFGVPKCAGSNVLNNKALSVPKPIVKNSIRRRYLQSKSEQTVTVQVVIDETGAVIEAKALTGNPLLRAACEISAREAKFAPTLINMPIKISGILIYKFKPDGTISDDFPKL